MADFHDDFRDDIARARAANDQFNAELRNNEELQEQIVEFAVCANVLALEMRAAGADRTNVFGFLSGVLISASDRAFGLPTAGE